MVLVIYLEGVAASVANAAAEVRTLSDGYVELRGDLFIITSDLDMREWRDHIAPFGARVVVAKLSGSWAVQGMSDVSSWLKDVRREF
jgi:hypothetical protein